MKNTMYEDIRDLADTIDEVEEELWRQKTMTPDPKMEEWYEENAQYMSRMRNQLKNYLTRLKGAKYA